MFAFAVGARVTLATRATVMLTTTDYAFTRGVRIPLVIFKIIHPNFWDHRCASNNSIHRFQ